MVSAGRVSEARSMLLDGPVEVGPEGPEWDRAGELVRGGGTALLYAPLERLRAGKAAVPPCAGGGLRAGLVSATEREQYEGARALLERLACAVRGDGTGRVEWGVAGRPVLAGCEGVDVAVSCAEGIVLVGASGAGLIGVDVERTDRMLYGSGAGRRVCTPYELVSLAKLAPPERDAELARLWTLKEAYRKAVGWGAGFPFGQFGFGPDGRPVRVQRPDGTAARGEEWEFRSAELPGGFRMGAALFTPRGAAA
ncbi:4'-phosphopantetheinyl transferase superfamily protein [Streptomyces sp. NPDC032472]|uniref:4'-phosphopantetheinyl transferase family protein n=1 Tax=Streptomyces sp. NPDC032472 TaxID=3155018 RepID=UPI0033EBD2EA